MIQDIYPHKLDNHYDINAVPDMDSIVLYFTEEGVLHRLGQYKEYDNYLFFPAVQNCPVTYVFPQPDCSCMLKNQFRHFFTKRSLTYYGQ